jgi:hypothetical protein
MYIIYKQIWKHADICISSGNQYGVFYSKIILKASGGLVGCM